MFAYLDDIFFNVNLQKKFPKFIDGWSHGRIFTLIMN